MKYIKDFFYNFSDIIFAIVVVLGIGFILYINLDNLVNIDEKQSIIETKVETVEESAITVNVTVPSGISVEQLADLLAEYSVIDDKQNFLDSFETTDNVQIKSGSFEFEQGEDYKVIKAKLIQQ